ncbi:transposase [Aquincola sp. S2]|uniref:Transposase n=1 Tax=Pseudaquabacterium terrae TaxID=2732868 RepID=A0ABX2EV48_9BURK|nr:transposase [Aquabacterium terrae]NRF72419.1 transposase [Aquabacterium terrae]
MTSESGKTRRRYGEQFKAMVLAQCDEPGMSVAQVAMSHGINDNVVHRWRQLARGKNTAQRVTPDSQSTVLQHSAFVPLALPAPDAPEVETDVRLEIKRGAVTVGVAWPQPALGELAGFVRELLK